MYELNTDGYIGKYLTSNIGIGFQQWYRSVSSTNPDILVSTSLIPHHDKSIGARQFSEAEET